MTYNTANVRKKDAIEGGWRRVVHAYDCEECDMCEEPICPNCDGEHYSECGCPGPHQGDEYEYREIGGELLARRKPDE